MSSPNEIFIASEKYYNTLKLKIFTFIDNLHRAVRTIARNSCIFSEKLDQAYPRMEPVPGKSMLAYCIVCKEQLSVANKDKFDIEQHLNLQKHKSKSKLTMKEKLTHFLHKKKDPEKINFTRIEIVWCYHNVRHNQSFRSMNCTSKLLKKFVNPKLSCARTKTECAVTNVIAKLTDDQIFHELTKCNVVVSSDVSNHKAIKLLPILIKLVFLLIRV